MSTARAIQVSISHVALGVAVGSLIEGVLPPPSDGVSFQQAVFEAVVQVGLNGAALASMSAYLQRDDPTYGIPFSAALFEAQPGLAARIRLLAAVVKGQVAQAVQRTGPLMPAV